MQTHHPHLASLHDALKAELKGECDFSSAGLALYTSDASNYRQIPLGTVFPKDRSDIETTLRHCRNQNLPVLMRGGGTSQNGQCVNEAIILDCSRFMNNVIELDTESQEVLVEPGIVCDALKSAAEKHGLTFGPDPATHSRCTLGGMIGNNSCGPHSMLAGKTVENVLALEVLTHSGETFWAGPTSDDDLAEILAGDTEQSRIYSELLQLRDRYAEQIRDRYPSIKRRVSGYNLDQLLPENGFNVARALVGSEGTLVSVLSAKLKLITNPTCKTLFVLGFDDIFIAGDSVPDIMPFSPIAMEGLDWNIIGGLNDRNLRQREVGLLPEGRAWILIELAANNENELESLSRRFSEAMSDASRVRSIKRVIDVSDVKDIWSIREQGASATAMSLDPNEPDPVVGWEDTAVDPYQLGDYLRDFQALVDKYGYTTSLYGHFGDGCIHARITFDTRTTEGVQHWRNFSEEIAHLVVKYGGSLSGEHGDGQAKAEFLPIMFGEELMQAFREFKAIWDPSAQMNPGKLIDAYKMDENLRLGPDYRIAPTPTTLNFVEDIGGFARSTERCIGMGKCRAHEGAMCPSYQASGEERFSTRGRAHLLHEMLRGEVIQDGWKNEDILESLEHCLSCKACKHECPTQVDIAAYKAEFMSGHYESKTRPLHHHVFGKLGTLLPRLSKVSGFVNLMQATLLGSIAKKILGISPEKQLPALAKNNFLQWCNINADNTDENFHWIGRDQHPSVVLWTDSVNTYYRPELLISAVNVLKTCGFRVAVSRQHFCCGRPLYEYGFLDQAKKQLIDITENWYPQVPDNANIIVLEPSCLSVFQDESKRVLDTLAMQQIQQRTLTLTAFLEQHEIRPTAKLKNGVMHLHCHDKSSASSHDRLWMQRCFESLIEPDSGCCGMAGTYGMRTQTRPVAKKLFDRKLKPAINSASDESVVVTNGFSCSEQFLDLSVKESLHPVQVIERCL